MDRVLPDADEVARSFRATCEALADAVPDGWAGGPPQARAIVSGLPVPTLNGVWATEPAVEPAELERALGEVAEARVPFCLQVRPACRDVAAHVAASWRLTPIPEEIPLMAISRPIELDADPGELLVRRLADDEAEIHNALAADAFGLPQEVFTLVTRSLVTLPETRLYAGELGGEPVTTCLSMRLGEWGAIFNVATPTRHRRAGHGSAVTAHAVRDAFAAGAHTIWLQSSSAGYGVYERLGFRTIERWSCWIAA